MSTLMEDDYAPATRQLWPSIVSTILIIALAILIIYRRRSGEPERPLERLRDSVETMIARRARSN